MGLCRSRGVGQYSVAGEVHNIAYGRLTKPGAPAVIVLQGSHSLADSMFDPTVELARVQALCDAGYIVYGGDLAQTGSQGTFGSDTAISRVGSLVSYAQGAASLKAGSGKVMILATSGGVTAGVNYARQNPGKVAAMYLMVPLVDLQDFYTNRTSPTLAGSAFTQAEINTAYGGNFAGLVASHNPVQATDLANLANIPVRIAYSTNDQYINPPSVGTFVDAVNAAGGNAVAYSLGTVLHNPITVDPNDVVTFFQAHR